ncbi:hypothetical protein M422DRAFT_44232 [Sphaerobolus stellatus SS14]|nr:hypothetical protein M422DRAFT_44232 [Sphaerobolus stellatus SS14]
MAEARTTTGETSEPSSSTTPREIRITSGGKINVYVKAGLKHLRENSKAPLIFHTLPAKDKQVSNPEPGVEVQEDSEGHPKKKRKLVPTTLGISKLISVVEILKREYSAWALSRQDADGKHLDDELRLGVHQYNELTTLEDEQNEPGESTVHELLQGKNLYAGRKSIKKETSLAVPTREIDGS